jgi:hypothetical protein
LHIPIPFCSPCFSVSGFVAAWWGLGVVVIEGIIGK